MAIEIVSFPIKNCDFPVRHVSLPEGIYPKLYIYIRLVPLCIPLYSIHFYCIITINIPLF